MLIKQTEIALLLRIKSYPELQPTTSVACKFLVQLESHLRKRLRPGVTVYRLSKSEIRVFRV